MTTPQGDVRLAYTAEEAAEQLGVSRSTVYKLIADGQLESIRIGRSRRITAAALDLFLTAKATS